jgi:hypothetical protein
MTTIILNDNFQIIKDKNIQNLFTIEFESYSESIIKSLIKTKIIMGATVLSNYKTVRFKAFSIQTLNDYKKELYIKNGVKNIPIHIISIMLNNIATQLKYLISQCSHSFIGYNPENIIVIDQSKFAYLSTEHLSLIEDENIFLTYPFSLQDFYLSPEQTKIKELPSYIHFKTAYYSLACLIIIALSSDNNFAEEENDESFHIKITKLLEILPMKDTKLYYLLKRCLEEDPKERNIIFI